MKQSLIAIILLSILLSACTPVHSTAPETATETVAQTIPKTTAEPTTEPTTEPTLSPEELFIQSLPEKLREAHDLGIVDLTLLEEPERPCTIREAADILQKVYNLRFYEDSWILTNTVTEKNAAESATRSWFMKMMYAADAEALVGVDEKQSYSENLKDLTKTHTSSKIANALLGWWDNTGYVLAENKNGELEQWGTFYGKYPGATKLVKDYDEFSGDVATVSYALTRFDRKTGEKLMPWDENRNLNFTATMTVQEVVETALRYYNALEPKPDFVPYDEITHYDESIITPDLLTRESQLPDASCSHLPAEWHGISLSETGQADCMTYEQEIQAIKDAGFNFIRYNFSFIYYHGRVADCLYDNTDYIRGLNENRLKELDQLLAWCMERDIHLNLECHFGIGWPGSFDTNKLIDKMDYANPLAESWKALARRYADIPNKYLSFTLLEHSWGRSDEAHATFLAPTVEGIREVSPDRCMMTAVGESHLKGTGAAGLGIALTSPCKWGENLYFPYNRASYVKPAMEKTAWPYKEDGAMTDANAVLSKGSSGKAKHSPDAVAAVATEYGVGYMVSEWIPRLTYGASIVERTRYMDETMQAFLTDMTATMAAREYGWCYGDWMGSVGIAYSYPLVKDSAYTQVGDYLWIDEEMSGWFREINNAS